VLVRKLTECRSFIAGDGSLLKEILHPLKQSLEIRYSLAHAILNPKQKTYPHMLEHAEVYYILAGHGCMHIDNEANEVKKDDAIYIPPGRVQHIENTAGQNLEFLCIVDPAWEPEIERLVPEDQDTGIGD
jgi:mannose-6-phosphate isomerase-like protein (cupin superfamily)